MNHILHQIFKIILSILQKKNKKNETLHDNLPIRISIKKYKREFNSILFLIFSARFNA